MADQIAADGDRLIAHVDMDAFYASVELLSYPELRGLPVVIGGRSVQPLTGEDGVRQFARLRSYTGRGVVTTSTYEARKLGVFSAMGLMKSAQLAPDAILLPVNFDAYRHYSRLFKQAVAQICPLIEDRGIDEIYVDLTAAGSEEIYRHNLRLLPDRIKRAVLDATGLTCSVCVAPNKLLAKIGSEFDKPDGLTLLSAADIESRIWPLEVKKINGIGPRSAEKLNSLGIMTVGQIAAAPAELLRAHFGRSYAIWLHQVAAGVDNRPVVISSEPKSVSRETTFEQDLHARHDRDRLSQIFTNLCTQVAGDLQRKGYLGRTIGIKLRYADFRTLTRDVTLPAATADATVIRRAAGECLKRVPLVQRMRLLGVRVGALERPGEESSSGQAEQAQGELF